MRRIGRAVVALFSIVVLLAALYGAVMAVRWADGETGFGLLDRRPEQPLAFSSLNRYTKEAAARPSFRRYFTTMVVPAPEAGATEAPVVTKWERSRVVIKLLNSGGPGIEPYLRQLVGRLNRMQAEVRFAVGDTAPRITIRFLTHDAYARTIGDDSVGSTRTHYFLTSPGMIRARIAIDSGRQGSAGQVKATLIHELTHAIGCGGHFTLDLRPPPQRALRVQPDHHLEPERRGGDPPAVLALDRERDDGGAGRRLAAPLRPLGGLSRRGQRPSLRFPKVRAHSD